MSLITHCFQLYPLKIDQKNKHSLVETFYVFTNDFLAMERFPITRSVSGTDLSFV